MCGEWAWQGQSVLSLWFVYLLSIGKAIRMPPGLKPAAGLTIKWAFEFLAECKLETMNISCLLYIIFYEFLINHVCVWASVRLFIVVVICKHLHKSDQIFCILIDILDGFFILLLSREKTWLIYSWNACKLPRGQDKVQATQISRCQRVCNNNLHRQATTIITTAMTTFTFHKFSANNS